MQDFNKLRNLMVEKQLNQRGIKDPAVLRAMGEVPRHEFVPGQMAKYAYEDTPFVGERIQPKTYYACSFRSIGWQSRLDGVSAVMRFKLCDSVSVFDFCHRPCRL